MIFFNAIHQKLMQAKTPIDVFGDLSSYTPDALKRCFRIMAQQIHPDHHPDFKKAANDAFLKLQYWHDLALLHVQTRQGGLRFASKQHVYVTTAVSIRGNLTDLYPAKMETRPVILKIARHTKNNDLMLAESRLLTLINRQIKENPLIAHFPTLIESFKLEDSAGAERMVNVLEDQSEFITLADVLKAYPKGIHPADAAWMFNRLIAALAKTHELGWVHGAVTPPHLMINLADHNGKLIDWCYACHIGETIKAVAPTSKMFYPPEVFEKRPATPATDIYMASMTLLKLLGGDMATKAVPLSVPKPISAFLKACLLQSPHRRPQNSWTLFDDFQEILQRLYGAPRFRPFSLDNSN